jgi:hypothetical protein
MSLVGLSSIVNSCTSFLGGVEGRAEVGITVGVPNVNMLPPVVAGLGSAFAAPEPNEKGAELAEADAAGGPKLKGEGLAGLPGSAAIGALGVEPKVKGDDETGAGLAGSFCWPNPNPNAGCAASGAALLAKGFAAGAPKGFRGFAGSAVGVDVACPNANTGAFAASGSAAVPADPVVDPKPIMGFGCASGCGAATVAAEVPAPPPNINPPVAGGLEVSNAEEVIGSSFLAAPNMELPNIDVVGAMSALPDAT